MIIITIRRLWLAMLCSAVLLTSPGFARNTSPSVSSDLYRGDDSAQSATAPARLKNAVVDSLIDPAIELDPFTEAETQALFDEQNKLAKQQQQKLAIGIGRSVDELEGAIDLSQLNWLPVAGGRAAQFSVTSPDAAAIRIQIVAKNFPPGAELYFFDLDNPDIVFGPLTPREARLSRWSPTIDGSGVGVEVYLLEHSPVEDASLIIPRVSHLLSSPRYDHFKNLNHIGSSDGTCSSDVVCDSVGISESLINSVGKYIYTQTDGNSYLCTGTVLNDNVIQTQVPYFLTANHCVNNPTAAASMDLYWFFQRAVCGGPDPTSVTQQFGGATILASNQTTDYTLLQLNQNPPAGVGLSGWTAATVAINAGVLGVHHPKGDLKKINYGSAQSFGQFGAGIPPLTNVEPGINVLWTRGITEGGSSGSGLWTDFGNGPVLIGDLSTGIANCNNPRTTYARLDLNYPAIKRWIFADYSDIWYDPSRNGQGILMLRRGDTIYGAWYLYDENGNGMWLTFIGQLIDNMTTTASLLRFTGPALGTPWDNNQVVNTTPGTVTVTFNSPTNATFSYTVNGVSDTITLQPFDLNASSGTYTGAWYDPTQNGQGVQLLHSGNNLSGAWYLYDENGNGMWVTFVGVLNGTTLNATLLRFSGPNLGANWDANLVQSANVGTVTVNFTSNTAATFSYTLNNVTGNLNLVPFAP